MIEGRREILLLKKNFDVFTNPNTEPLLDALDPDEIVVFGVATDVCDDAAIRGFLQRGRRVVFVEDAAQGPRRGADAGLHRLLARRRSRVHDRRGGDCLPRLRDPSLLPMRRSRWWGTGSTAWRTSPRTWLPLAFFAILVLTAWLLWKTVGMMPRVRPTARRLPLEVARRPGTTSPASRRSAAELMEVVDFLRDPKRFERLGAKVPKGLLLYGPPGTGKTLLAKAVAHESGANFYSASASSFVEMFAGLGAARIRKLFAEARKHAPAIVFIDELDAVGAQRTGHGFNREQDQTLNQLLVELDGFEGAEQVVVMGASNRIQDLDQALLRPGRFDRQMLVPPPDLKGREAILEVHTRGKPLAHDVDLTQVARQTSGLTGAELANICNEAAIFAGRRGDASLTQSRLRRRARARRRRTAAEEGADREGAPDPRVPRGRPRADGASDGRGDGAAEGDDRLARRGARLRVLPARGGPLPPHEGGARSTG